MINFISGGGSISHTHTYILSLLQRFHLTVIQTKFKQTNKKSNSAVVLCVDLYRLTNDEHLSKINRSAVTDEWKINMSRKKQLKFNNQKTGSTGILRYYQVLRFNSNSLPNIHKQYQIGSNIAIKYRKEKHSN